MYTKLISALTALEHTSQFDFTTLQTALDASCMLAKNTRSHRKELQFIITSLKGLVDGFSLFTQEELGLEVAKVTQKFEAVKTRVLNQKWDAIFKAPAGMLYLDLSVEHFATLARVVGKERVIKDLKMLQSEEPDKEAWVMERIRALEAQVIAARSFREQLQDLQILGTQNRATRVEEVDKSVLNETTETVLKRLKRSFKELHVEESGNLTGAIVIVTTIGFDKQLAQQFARKGYRLKTLSSATYVALYNAQLCGLPLGTEAGKVAVRPGFSIIGNPVHTAKHTYFWQLEDELSVGLHIATWDLPT